MATRRAVPLGIRTTALWCGLGAVLAVPAVVAPPAVASGSAAPARGAVCLTSGPVRHAAAGIDFGGKELAPSSVRTRGAVTDLLRNGPLPEGAVADPVRRTVTLAAGTQPMVVDVEAVRMPGDLPYAPVALAHVRSARSAVVRVSDRAAADLVRAAVTARLAELAVVARQRADGQRPDVTSGLVEGLLTTADGSGKVPLSARDIGRVAALEALTAPNGTGAPSDPAVVLGAATAMGLLDQGDTEPHTMAGNRPLAGEKAAAARVTTVRGLSSAARTAVNRALELSVEQPVTLSDIRAEQECERRELRTRSDQLIARRDRQDQQLTTVLDARFRQRPVVPHVIVGAGWAGTVDYLTFEAPAPAPVPSPGADPLVPPVLVLAGGGGVVNSLGDFRLTQPAMDMELPEAPFQPHDFAGDRTDFVTSTAFGRAVGVARALSGMPTYRAGVSRVEARPDAAEEADAADWPAGAGYRLTLTDGRQVYARTLDLTTGLGPPRIPDTDQSALNGRAFKDPRTNWRVEFDQDATPHLFDAQDRPSAGPLPEQSSWLLGIRGQGSSLTSYRKPFLLDPQGRPTEYRVVDEDSRYSVDPDTGRAFDPAGAQVLPGDLDAGVRSRLGFGPGPAFAFRDPRFVADPASGLSVNPVTGAVVTTATGRPPLTRPLPAVQRRLDALVRAHRVQYGGQNTAADYGPSDTVYIVGGGAGGASEVEQATGQDRRVIWGARQARLTPTPEFPPGARGAVDPQHLWSEYRSEADPQRKQALLRDLSFVTGGGYNRRNTLPDIGAYTLSVWNRAIRTIDLPTAIQYTTGDRFRTTGPGGRVPCDRLVYTIGQDAAYPGGAGALLGVTPLTRLTGPGGELNGLEDTSGGLRVLGAAGVTGAVTKLIEPSEQPLALRQINDQGRALPPDARDIHPSIRYHAFRIAEANRTFRSGR